MQQGNRHNKGKPRPSLISPEFLLALGETLERGAEKYGVNNWRLGLSYSETMDSIQRHLLAYQTGRKVDSEDGTLHLANAAAGLMFLTCFDMDQERYKRFDDRFLVGKPAPKKIPINPEDVKRALAEQNTNGSTERVRVDPQEESDSDRPDING